MDTQCKNPAVIPLALPKTAGPGATATVITLGDTHTWQSSAGNMIAIVTGIAMASCSAPAKSRRRWARAG